MLIIDDNMLKLAKMQEALLKMSNSNRQENVQKYKEIITKIDKQAFESLTKELENYIKHNQDMLDELKFLEVIKTYYNQITELQLTFIKVYQTYSNKEIKLSDLSEIDIEYIDNRISVISGYLSNQKNLETNKKTIEELNIKLVEEEKKHEYLEKKMLKFEEKLRNNFLEAEGRIIEDGKLQYISIITEYDKIGYDFKYLLTNLKELKKELRKTEENKNEIEEKLTIAEICYNSSPNVSNKQIYNDIELEYYKTKYNLIMLKIIDLLVDNNKEYDVFKEKREKLLDLIVNREICLKKLHINISIDPFKRTKISEQLEDINSEKDNEKTINKIKKEIANLNEKIEDMIQNNGKYQKELLYKKNNLLKEKIVKIDIYNQETNKKIDDFINIKTYLENQVVSVRKPLQSLNMRIVNDKTSNLIKRVNDMISISNKDNKSSQIISTPELIIVPEIVNKEITNTKLINKTEKTFIEPTLEINEELKELESNNKGKIAEEKATEISSSSNDLFSTLKPFEDIVLFEDKVDENIEKNEKELKIELEKTADEMPEAFWITQEDIKKEQDNTAEEPSFDEQIEALLSSDNTKNLVKKLSA